MKTIIGSAIAAGCVLFAGSAMAEPIGYIEGGYGYDQVKLDTFGTFHTNAYSLEGGVAFDATDKFRITGDAGVTKFKSKEMGEDVVSALTLHVTDKASRFGAFAGVTDNEDATLWGVGAEGKWSNDKASVYGQLGYGQESKWDDLDLWAGRVEGNYFPNSNLRLGGGLGAAHITSDLIDIDMYTATVEAEYKLKDQPVSFVAGYDYATLDDLNIDTHVFRVGARYTFGGDLKARDKTTAGQGSVEKLFGGSFGSSMLSLFGAVINEFDD